MPPEAKLPTTPRSAISRRTAAAVERETPPAPVWNENPSSSSPLAAITALAVSPILRPVGSVAGRVAPEAMPPGSPIESISTTKSTLCCGMSMAASG